MSVFGFKLFEDVVNGFFGVGFGVVGVDVECGVIFFWLGGRMKVVVGLINLVKVEVVREVFLGIYGDVEVVFIEVDSGVFD